MGKMNAEQQDHGKMREEASCYSLHFRNTHGGELGYLRTLSVDAIEEEEEENLVE